MERSATGFGKDRNSEIYSARVQSFLPLTQTCWFTLLSLLKGPKHGYAISADINNLSEGRLGRNHGSLYVSLREYEKKGLIDLLGESGMRRKLYAITDLGQDVILAEYERMGIAQRAFDRILNE